MIILLILYLKTCGCAPRFRSYRNCKLKTNKPNYFIYLIGFITISYYFLAPVCRQKRFIKLIISYD